MTLCGIYLIGFTIMLTVSILALIFGGNKIGSKVDNFFSEILKETEHGKLKWSQGRVYLMFSLMFYFFVLALMSIKAVKPDTEVKNESFELVISALQWVIALFAGYVFGAKGLKVLDSIIKYRLTSKKENTAGTDVSLPTEPTTNENPKQPEI